MIRPCCAESPDEVCAQHAQAARVIRYEGMRNRSYRGGAVVGEPGKAKPVRDTEETP